MAHESSLSLDVNLKGIQAGQGIEPTDGLGAWAHIRNLVACHQISRLPSHDELPTIAMPPLQTPRPHDLPQDNSHRLPASSVVFSRFLLSRSALVGVALTKSKSSKSKTEAPSSSTDEVIQFGRIAVYPHGAKVFKNAKQKKQVGFGANKLTDNGFQLPLAAPHAHVQNFFEKTLPEVLKAARSVASALQPGEFPLFLIVKSGKELLPLFNDAPDASDLYDCLTNVGPNVKWRDCCVWVGTKTDVYEILKEQLRDANAYISDADETSDAEYESEPSKGKKHRAKVTAPLSPGIVYSDTEAPIASGSGTSSTSSSATSTSGATSASPTTPSADADSEVKIVEVVKEPIKSTARPESKWAVLFK
ncbi:hypothetical protein EXIGLDRAFT_772097 [Exidia glandulosa HHB12029]|uniref:Uncharacterized protein n=1 Tax=Exidia glandulosa HHB12029 TaxID=1314781 RepID=A0A165FJ91_EXIGL|nr:hypothetical protein EXIGLDRAFT_772097 [Exidia glandulosa HHB12029]